MSYVIGTIYKIYYKLDPTIQYVGSTYQSIKERWSHHMDIYTKKYTKKITIYPYFWDLGVENFEIEKIKDYLVYREDQKDRKHLSVYEQLWINKLKCVNKIAAFNPLRHLKQKIIYMTAEQIEKKNAAQRVENMTAEKIEKTNAKKRVENMTAEQIEKTNASQRVENMTAEKIQKQKERKKKKIKCEICDIEITIDNMSAHKKSKKHLKNLEEYNKNNKK